MFTRVQKRSSWSIGSSTVIFAAITAILFVSVLAAARLQQVQLAEAMLKDAATQSMRVKFQTIDAFDRYYSKIIVPRATAAGAQLTHDFQHNPRDLPFPATFMKDVAEWLGDTNPGQEYRIYSDYPFPFRENGGPIDSFETEALRKFRSGEATETFEFVERPNGLLLRAAFQVKMEQACVDCHNSLNESPMRNWKVGDIRGATSLSMNLPPVPGFFTAENLRWQLPALTSLLALLSVPLIALFVSRWRAKERIKLERLARERDKALAASKAKTDFMGNMSHELRTPLNAIIGFSQMIENGINDKNSREYARDIETSGRHLLDLISDLLDLEKIERRKIDLVETEFDILETIKENVRLIESVGDNINRGIRIKITGSPVVVYGDQRMMSQVIINLLSNATKFSRLGGVVDVALAVVGSGDLIVEVEDRGIGISESAIKQVFQPFVQANAQVTRTHGGTGLGLAIIKEQIELHGGEIDMASQEGVGTTVSFTLPASRLRCSTLKAA